MTRISSEHQNTVPDDAPRRCRVEIGERDIAHADGLGRVVLEHRHDVLGEFAGAMAGAGVSNELDELRAAWDPGTAGVPMGVASWKCSFL